MPKPSKQFTSFNKSALKKQRQHVSSKKADPKPPKITPRISRDEAATRIALAWRRKFRFFTTNKLVLKYISSGPTVERVKAMG